jgi:hypothetical protein
MQDRNRLPPLTLTNRDRNSVPSADQVVPAPTAAKFLSRVAAAGAAALADAAPVQLKKVSPHRRLQSRVA